MEIKELISFVSIVQHGSFSKAARKLGYSQAAITIQVRNLEKELGVRLLDRFRKKVSLTNSGQIFYQKVIPLLNGLTEASESVRNKKSLSGTLVIGATDSVCMSILPPLIREYSRENPDVSIKIVTDTIDRLLELVDHNEVDFVYLVDQKILRKNLTTIFEFKSRVYFMAGRDHPLAGTHDPSLADLLGYPLVLTEEDASYRRLLDLEMVRRDLEIRPAIEAKSTEFILDNLGEGDGISFLPEYLLTDQTRYSHIHMFRVQDIDISVYLQLICHKSKWVSKEMRSFFDRAAAAGEELARRMADQE